LFNDAGHDGTMPAHPATVLDEARSLYELADQPTAAGSAARLTGQVYLELGKLGKAKRSATLALTLFKDAGRGAKSDQVVRTRKLLAAIKQAKRDREADQADER
jgi:hypothetical protein